MIESLAVMHRGERGHQCETTSPSNAPRPDLSVMLRQKTSLYNGSFIDDSMTARSAGVCDGYTPTVEPQRRKMKHAQTCNEDMCWSTVTRCALSQLLPTIRICGVSDVGAKDLVYYDPPPAPPPSRRPHTVSDKERHKPRIWLQHAVFQEWEGIGVGMKCTSPSNS
jgi:hypothetical protein